uniref:nickel pincer cofactor biosynthesis protein LarC n=1 Tax=Micromonospora sp. S4605 TaxID=1420897 RepID=UPI001E621E7A|nr:nickel pincer cofactor biosynthesis protein LarC [Micromonospora sp. S4605]
MRVLWVDAGNGAAGDMLLGALLDAGADLDRVRAGLAQLGLEEMRVGLRQVRRHGLRAARAVVEVPDAATSRGLAEIVAAVNTAGLPAPVRDFAVATFDRLARAEARVHGVPVERIHFHEVGALDAVVDVVGCALALHELDLLGAQARIVGPVAVGSGTVHSAHGPLPVPAPAVLELLVAAGAPIREHPAQRELCTPTGAALLTTLATGWGPAPSCVPTAAGVGAGSADPPGHPNVLRLLVGRDAPTGPGPEWVTSALHRVDATVDDLDPRVWPDLLHQLRAAGAADAWCTPALTHHGRPGQVLSVLTEAERVDLLCGIVFEETTTLGVRISTVERRALRRDEVTVTIAGCAVAVKRGHVGDRVVTVQPEYQEALTVARRTGLPVAEVLARAAEAAQPASTGEAAARQTVPGAAGATGGPSHAGDR